MIFTRVQIQGAGLVRCGFFVLKDNMTEHMLINELRRQLEVLKKHPLGKLDGCKAGDLHQLRSASLRLGILLGYASRKKIRNLAHCLLECRKAMAARRNCDVSLSRIKGQMREFSLSKKSRRQIRKAITALNHKAQRKMVRSLREMRFARLLSRIIAIVDDPGRIDLAEIHRDNIVVQRPNEWMPEQFHRIRKRLRLIKYVYELMKGHGPSDNVQGNHNWILRYQSVLGDYIDGANTLRVLKRLKGIKKRLIKSLVARERERMQRCRWLLKSMPWPDTVSFSGTASQENRP